MRHASMPNGQGHVSRKRPDPRGYNPDNFRLQKINFSMDGAGKTFRQAHLLKYAKY